MSSKFRNVFFQPTSDDTLTVSMAQFAGTTVHLKPNQVVSLGDLAEPKRLDRDKQFSQPTPQGAPQPGYDPNYSHLRSYFQQSQEGQQRFVVDVDAKDSVQVLKNAKVVRVKLSTADQKESKFSFYKLVKDNKKSIGELITKSNVGIGENDSRLNDIVIISGIDQQGQKCYYVQLYDAIKSAKPPAAFTEITSNQEFCKQLQKCFDLEKQQSLYCSVLPDNAWQVVLNPYAIQSICKTFYAQQGQGGATVARNYVVSKNASGYSVQISDQQHKQKSAQFQIHVDSNNVGRLELLLQTNPPQQRQNQPPQIDPRLTEDSIARAVSIFQFLVDVCCAGENPSQQKVINQGLIKASNEEVPAKTIVRAAKVVTIDLTGTSPVQTKQLLAQFKQLANSKLYSDVKIFIHTVNPERNNGNSPPEDIPLNSAASEYNASKGPSSAMRPVSSA